MENTRKMPNDRGLCEVCVCENFPGGSVGVWIVIYALTARHNKGGVMRAKFCDFRWLHIISGAAVTREALQRKKH